MQTHQLVAHPSFAPDKVRAVSVKWAPLRDGRLMLRYFVDGCDKLSVPGLKGRGRAEDLWKTTCFELFLYDGEGRYREFNFSPSGQWAAYRFTGYRSLAENFEPVRWPEIISERGLQKFVLTAFIDSRELAGAERGALSAVIEENRKRPSYWALAHAGLKPDFHDPACFRLELGPANGA